MYQHEITLNAEGSNQRGGAIDIDNWSGGLEASFSGRKSMQANKHLSYDMEESLDGFLPLKSMNLSHLPLNGTNPMKKRP